MPSALTLRAVEFRWNKTGQRLGPITETISVGDFIGLIGPNGAGKSTLLRLIAAYLKPTQGDIDLFDHSLGVLSPAKRARLVAVVPQALSTHFDLSVSEVVELGRTAHLSFRHRLAPSSAEHRQAIHRAMEATGILEFQQRPFSALSGGEAQRVLLAMALAQETPILLLDEPTAHLDPGHARHFLDLVQNLAALQQKTILMAYHDLTTVGLYCDSLWLMHQGQLVMTGTPQTVLSAPLIREVYNTGFVQLQHPRSQKPMLLFP